ncbi:MAG TPA: glucose-6-phosphate dehydrogenase [Patescibacteria group bacterium]|nr:glucose-6-phosphate dehydrogenase [Patescibacteria group bacterium]
MGPFVIVIFGATGDLAQHKLFPALFSLFQQQKLGQDFYIVGFARRSFSDKEYREFIGTELNLLNDKSWKEFSSHLYYQQGLFDEQQGYNELISKLKTFDDEIGACITRLFYLATPPGNYEKILDFMRSTELSEGCGQGSEKWTRLAIEKPFGKDLTTARNLDRKLAEIFEEKQVFRIDHYLGKETVQNMIAFRFANSIFEPIWNKEHIDHIQITLSETRGIGKRGKFFDGVGMLRDVGQNHLLQLLATVAMEQPKSFEREAVRDERAHAIMAIKPMTEDTVTQSVIRGQYAGYAEEKDIQQGSMTETYIAMKLFVDTPRFEGVPFYLRAGFRADRNFVDIKIVFKQTCHILFKEAGCPEVGNVLTIRIQPDEGISFRTIVKKPGAKLDLDTVSMSFSYHQSFGHRGIDAYEKVLLDILAGDQMLFNRSDELESSWQLISTILNAWEKSEGKDLVRYEQETPGPKEADELIERDGRKWL